jgi:WD40 repeat protein/MinD-like ATPase involved in chromosome partitioning or flagellar assembly
MTEPKRDGQIVTFYSYKGGTGRSMMLANVAWVLASRGQRVLVLDWDLEAPGLHRYFYPFLRDPELTSSEGVIDFVHKFVAAAAIPPAGKGAPDDDEWFRPYANILRYAASLNWNFKDGGALDFIPAGRQGPSYPTRINTFDWEHFYQELGGWRLLELARERMREEYDYVLIDSRTGVSDTSGICTIDLPDVLVICFTLNNQGIDGAARVALDVFEKRGGAPPAGGSPPADGARAAPVRILPVPMRIENAEKVKLQARRNYAREKFKLFPAGLTPEQAEQYWGDVQAPYVPFYAYEEILATFGDSPSDRFSILAAAQHLTSYLTGGAVSRVADIEREERGRVLREFEGGPAVTDPSAEEERFAESIYLRLDAAQQELTLRLLSRLIRVAEPEEVGGDTLLRVGAGEFEPPQAESLRELVNAGLVQRDRDPSGGGEVFKIASDTLHVNWGRLRRWLDEDREFLLWRQRLHPKVVEWQRSGRDPSALLSGKLLERARWFLEKRRADLNAAQISYIGRSADEEERQRAEQERLLEERDTIRQESETLKDQSQNYQQRIQSLMRQFAVVVLIVGSAFVVYFLYDNYTRRAETRKSESIQLVAMATLTENPELRVLLSSEAARMDENETTQSGLSSALREYHQLAVLSGHTDSVFDAAYSPDGSRIVTASADGTAIIWDADGAGWRQGQVLKGHDGRVFGAAFRPDGRVVATAGSDGQVLFFDAGTGARLGYWRSAAAVQGLSFSPDGRYLVTGTSGNGVLMYEATGRQQEYSLLRVLGRHDDGVTGVAFSPDGQLLASASADQSVRLWDVKQQKPLRELRGHSGSVYQVAFSPDGRFVVSAGQDSTARVWDVSSGEMIRLIRPGAGEVRGAAYSPDGSRIAVANLDAALLYDVGTGQARITLRGHSGQVNSVAFSPDGKRVVTGGSDATARVWDVSDSLSVGEPVEQLRATACQKVTRNLTAEEWKQYMGDEPYRKTCENLP